jgi:hypothetical protein
MPSIKLENQSKEKVSSWATKIETKKIYSTSLRKPKRVKFEENKLYVD